MIELKRDARWLLTSVQFRASEESASLEDKNNSTADDVENAIQALMEPEADGVNTDENSSEGVDQINDQTPPDAESSSQHDSGSGWQTVENNDLASMTEAQDESFQSSSKNSTSVAYRSFLSPSILIQDELDRFDGIHLQNQSSEWTDVTGAASCPTEAAKISTEDTAAGPSHRRRTAEGKGGRWWPSRMTLDYFCSSF